MNELDETERALLALASDAHEPTDRDRARVRAALAARLGVAAGLGVGATVGLAATAKAAAATGVGSTGTASAAVTGGALATKLVIAVALTATVGVGATVKLTRRTPHVPAAITSTDVRRGSRQRPVASTPRPFPANQAAEPEAQPSGAAPVVQETAPSIEPSPGPDTAPQLARHARPEVTPQPPEVRAPAASRPAASAATPSALACVAGPGEDAGPRRPEFTVADEARLVRDGVRALRDGQPACALSLLDTHARYYPTGVLAEEREAERALALADLGRVAEARATAAAFLRKHPASPLGARLRERITGLPAAP